MENQKALNLINNMIKAAPSCKAALGSFEITPGGPKQEGTGASMEQLQTHHAKKREAAGIPVAPGLPSKLPGTNKAQIGEVEITKEGPAKKTKGGKMIPLHGEEGFYAQAERVRGKLTGAGGPFRREATVVASNRLRPAGGWGPVREASGRESKALKALGKAGLFGGEAQKPVPAGQVMSKLGAGGPPGQSAAPSAPGQGGLAGHTVSMQSMVPKKDLGAAKPAHMPGAMQPGQTVSMQKIASARKAVPPDASRSEWEKDEEKAKDKKELPLLVKKGEFLRSWYTKPGSDPAIERHFGAGAKEKRAQFLAKPKQKEEVGSPLKQRLQAGKPAEKAFPSHPITPSASKSQHVRDGSGPHGQGAGPGKGQGCGGVNKALRASSIPRISRGLAMAQEQYRSATAVMTRGNSRFSKDIHTGPLTGEVIRDLEDDAAARTRKAIPIYKSCCICGRTYLAKSHDAECPTCSVNKSQMCSCGYMLVKGPSNERYCPICG